ncbi:MAG TPA: 6,7-dimethyl-8-ribityllumazine synthase [Fibrobacteria bacterium]|nr:6,7-dimethyl-8-ribityllumazine synthase [Fibrobacteria bacterium]
MVVARFNANITEPLMEGAVECLEEHGASSEDIRVFRVPGAVEIPQALARLAASGTKYDGLIALGCVIRGETAHFDAVVDLATQGFTQVVNGGIPMAFGVLTTENLEQAVARTGHGAGNKGWEAALAVLEMSGLWEKLK